MSNRSNLFAIFLTALVLCRMSAFAGGSGSQNTLTGPTNAIVCPGANVTLTGTAGGPTPYSFKWSKNGALLSGKTTNTLTLSNVSSNDAGAYALILTGGHNSVTNSATLTVRTLVSVPAMTNLVRAIGANALFVPTPAGTGPFTYLWQKNGTNLAGRTSSSLLLTNLTSADSAIYTVIVSGPCNSASSSATLMVDSCFPSVDVLLVIDRSGSMTGEPYNDARAACSNFVQNLHFTNNGDLAGLASYNSSATLDQKLTNNLLVLDNAIHGIPAAGGNTSISLGLQTGQTELASVRHNSNALPVMVLLSDGLPTGTDTPSNALYIATLAKNAGTRIFTVGLGAVDPHLMAGIASSTNDFYYATNSSQLSGLFNAISSIICRPPTNIVAAGPSNLTVCAGSTAAFSVTATGCNSFTYQWQKNGQRIAGQTSSALTILSAGTNDAGVYSVEVHSACQSVTNSATLAVNENAFVSTPPANQSACPGDTVMFNVSATGAALSYQWYKENALLAGQTQSSLVISNVNATSAGVYSVVAAGTCGNPITNSAVLVVNENLFVVTSPLNQTNCLGSTAIFSINAKGTAVAYQWYKGSTLLVGETGSSLIITNVSAANAGIYSVAVSGICGIPITNSAALVVNQIVNVSTPPANQTNCPGAMAVFTVSATGTGIAYQWYQGATLLAGESGSALTITNVTATKAGVYSVVVSGTCGNPITNSAILVINENVAVTTPPSSQTNCPGTTAIFNIVASGTGTAYQWYKGCGLLVGETASSLIITNVSATHAGIYSVAISGICGSPITNSAALVVNETVNVSTPPANQTNCPGTMAVFTVSAAGTGIAYQWYQGATLLAGESGSALTITNVTATNAGVYSVVVSGICGNPMTNSAILVINENVAVTTPPSSQTNCPGSTSIFNITASGSGIAYQWYKGSALLAGETASSLIITNVSATHAGIYSVAVSGVCGSPITNSAALVVNQTVNVFTPPANQTNCPGAMAVFTVSATGTGVAYQWYQGSTLLAGETGATLTITNVTARNAGIYSVIVSGTCGNPVTNSAILVVNENLIVATPPSNQTNCPGTTTIFNIVASGTGIAYQWYKGSSLLAGETASSLIITNVSATHAGIYSVVVSGICGNPITNSAILVVNENLLVLTSPSNQTNCPGTTASFSISATGTGLNYQWYRSTSLLPGETNATLTITNVSAANGGSYCVVASSACGTATNSAILVVNDLTTATALANTIRNPGESVTFSTAAAGTGPFTYLWKKNGTVIPGATTNILALSNLTFADAATYSVEVSGRCNTAVQMATLSVNHPPTVDIFAPTNGAIFIAPATFTLAANAADTDGIVTNVEFFLFSTNKLGETTNSAPATLIVTNLAAGDYTFTARAADNLNAHGTSAPVTVSVIQHLPLTITSSVHFDPQTGLFEQTVRVFNPTYSDINAVRVYISNIDTNTTHVYNASGFLGGTAYIESHALLNPGFFVQFVIEYYVPTRVPPNPVLTADLVPLARGGGSPAIGAQQHIDRGIMLPSRFFLVEFLTLSNRIYSVQYSADLTNWRDAQPAVRGNGTRIQWIDDGEPKTVSDPDSAPARFYRVILLP